MKAKGEATSILLTVNRRKRRITSMTTTSVAHNTEGAAPKRHGAEPKFQIGDAVTFTNDYGVVFPGKTVIGVEVWSWQADEYRYFISPTDTPWFSAPERCLAPAGSVPAYDATPEAS